jgi:hypothetical protein
MAEPEPPCRLYESRPVMMLNTRIEPSPQPVARNLPRHATQGVESASACPHMMLTEQQLRHTWCQTTRARGVAVHDIDDDDDIHVMSPHRPSGEKRTAKTSEELSVMVMEGVMRWVGCVPAVNTRYACLIPHGRPV